MGITGVPCSALLETLDEARASLTREAAAKGKMSWMEEKYQVLARSPSYDNRHVVIDVQLDVYAAKRKKPETGAEFVAHYFRTRVQPVLDSKTTLVLIFDNGSKTPRCKAATQMKRRRNKALVDLHFPIGDDEMLPVEREWYNLLATTPVRSRLFEYMLYGLTRAVEAYTDGMEEHYGTVYASAPWLSTCHFGESKFTRGQFLELTNLGPELAPLPPVSCQGEGDMLCYVWSNFLHDQQQDKPRDERKAVVVTSKDLDMIGIYSSMRSKGDVLLHITSSNANDGQPRRYGFLDVRVLWEDVFAGSLQRGLHFTLSLVLSGSDFSEGVRGINGLRIVRTALGLRPIKDPMKRSNAGNRSYFSQDNLMIRGHASAPMVLKRRVERILRTASTKKSFVFNQPFMLRRASWNLLYWANIENKPDPEAVEAWRTNDKGIYLPIEDQIKRKGM